MQERLFPLHVFPSDTQSTFYLFILKQHWRITRPVMDHNELKLLTRTWLYLRLWYTHNISKAMPGSSVQHPGSLPTKGLLAVPHLLQRKTSVPGAFPRPGGTADHP